MKNGPRRVIVSQRFFDDAATAYLQSKGCEVVVADLPPGQADGGLSHEELVAMLQGAEGWIVGHARVTRELLSDLPDLQIISRRGVGYERVDIVAATDFGRVVTIAAGGNEDTTAEHAVALMLAVGHRLREQQQQMIAGKWSILIGSDLFRKTVGIVGLGRIGRSVVKRLRGFETRILVHTPRPDAAFGREHGVEYVDLQTILAESDYLTLHAPLNAATRYLVRDETIAQMRPTAIVINTARGGLVEDAHLLEALKTGRLAGAGLDVFMAESDPAYRPVADELLSLPNVAATPHSGASTVEGLARTNMIAAECVVAVFEGRKPQPQCVVADGRNAASKVAAS